MILTLMYFYYCIFERILIKIEFAIDSDKGMGPFFHIGMLNLNK